MSFVGHAARCLDGDMDLAGLASARLEKPGDHVAEASAAMGEFALPDFLPWPSQSVTTCSCAPSIPTNQSSLFVHHALPSNQRHTRRAC
jgi:hypothetical protein